MDESLFCLVEAARCLKVVACDPFTGTIQKVFNCQSSDVEGGATCITRLSNSYLLCALQKKPILCVWNLRKEQTVSKISVPGLVSALACAPNGKFCVAGIAEKIYTWEVSTGHLLAVTSNHYQAISVLAFTDDGVHLISGGKDCRVIVWRFSNLLAEANVSTGFMLPYTSAQGNRLPPAAVRHIWSDHSLPVTDVWCGFGGLQSRVVTVSMDQTCKIYELCSGKLLCSFLFDMALTCVVMDKAEHLAFVGGVNGKIAQVNLLLQHSKQLQKLDGIPEGDCSNQCTYFSGHTKAVTGLTVSNYNIQLVLISTSLDGEVRLWDVLSCQTIKVISHKGVISKMFSLTGAFTEHISDQIQVKPFGKHLHHTNNSQDETEAVACIPVQISGIDPLFDLGISGSLFLYDREEQNELRTPQRLFKLLSEQEDMAAKQSKERNMLYNAAMEELTL